MIPDLNCIHVERFGRRQLRLHRARVLLDAEECSYYFTAGPENRGRITFSREGFLPCFEQGVNQFHTLRTRLHEIKFRAPLSR